MRYFLAQPLWLTRMRLNASLPSWSFALLLLVMTLMCDRSTAQPGPAHPQTTDYQIETIDVQI